MGIHWGRVPCPRSRGAGAGVRKKGGRRPIRIRDNGAPLIGAGRPAPRPVPGVGKSWLIRLIATAPPLRQTTVFSATTRRRGPPISGACTAPRGPRGDENRGKSDELLSDVRARKEALSARRRMSAISTSTPFRIGRRRIDGVGNMPLFSVIMDLEVGRAARCRLAATPPSPD